MRHAQILGTGVHVPSIEVSNDVMRERFATVAPDFIDRIEPKSGIGKRFYAPDDQATSDLAAAAAREALAVAGVAAEDLDLIILGTDSPDYITPSTSVVVQKKIGAMKAGTFDVQCACASFPTALGVARGMIATQPHLNRVLVIGAYMMRKLADPMDPMVFLYGDGAGAAVLGPSDEPGVLSSAFAADGNLATDWCIAAGGTQEPVTKEAIDAGRHVVRMTKKSPPAVNDEGWPSLARRLAELENVSLDEVDSFIFTQVRKRTIEKVMENLGQPMEKAHLIMGQWGYTGSACVPMALHDAIVRRVVGPGSLVFMVGSGVGFNQAATALRLTDALRIPEQMEGNAS
ncbi:MAG: 3-oxoacyl-ACP synthase [Sandaracinus sp.]|nr:3-oxoacyl-ACP synthase [Sandaracinus sp.]